jgi:hypothetical protein
VADRRRRSGDHGLVAEALRDLAYVENTSGRAASTRRLLAAAAAAAGDDAHAMSSVRAIQGMFLAGRVQAAERRLGHVWSLSLVLGDWCWQGTAARGLGMVAFARGDLPEALRWLEEAVRRAAQDQDRDVWIHAWVQEALCRVSVAAGLPCAAADVARLTALAARSRLPEFAVRAELHRAALGPRSSRGDRARTLAAAVDNPALV